MLIWIEWNQSITLISLNKAQWLVYSVQIYMCLRCALQVRYHWKVVLIIDLHFVVLSEADMFCFRCIKVIPNIIKESV